MGLWLSAYILTGYHNLDIDFKAWFKCQTLYVLNLITRFSTCKALHLNQLRSTDLYLGRPAVLFDWACQIEWQKINLVFKR